MATWQELAAANNAEWCDIVARAHGADTTFAGDAWTSRTRTPPHYPDAVTLVADPSLPELLARVDTSAGCSVKDSFASIDLRSLGFHVLLEAQWIVLGSTAGLAAGADIAWEVVDEPSELVVWERAWRGDDGPTGLFPGDLLACDPVTVLAARSDDRVVGGAVLLRSDEVVGVSNFFADAGVPGAGWHGCLAAADRLFPGAPIVGYEFGDALEAAQAHGFEAAGPLRVWVKDR